MSANASTWFYTEPENEPFLISERLNGTFWQARISDVYWKCTNSATPFKAVGYMSEDIFELEWEPGHWLALTFPQGVEPDRYIEVVSKRVLASKTSASYIDPQGRQVFEWHTEAGKSRWSDIQGNPACSLVKRL
jgi:hypothetical protein